MLASVSAMRADVMENPLELGSFRRSESFSQDYAAGVSVKLARAVRLGGASESADAGGYHKNTKRVGNEPDELANGRLRIDRPAA